METEFSQTGIPGLDELLKGGLPRGGSNILLGGPGTGKTTFALQFLYHGAISGKEHGVFITLNETPEELRRSAAKYDWDIRKLEEHGLFTFIDARPFKVSDKGFVIPDADLFGGKDEIPFSKIANLVFSLSKAGKARRVIVDSLNVLLSQFREDFVSRQGLIGLIQALNHFGCTSLLILEQIAGVVSPEEYLAQGVVGLSVSSRNGALTRAIQILKMRGVNHSLDIHPLVITKTGISVFPKEKLLL